MAEAGADPQPPLYCRTRAEAMGAVRARIKAAQAAGDRLLMGFDFPMGYPSGFAEAITGKTDALALWTWIARHVEDAPNNVNNRFIVAETLNRITPGDGPFWGCPARAETPLLRQTKPAAIVFPERRAVEALIPRAQPCWKLFTTGSVGSQAITGIARLEHLRQSMVGQIAVWPFQPWDEAPVVIAEIYPSLLTVAVDARLARQDTIKDAVQVETLADALWRLQQASGLDHALSMAKGAPTDEGWVLGVGVEDALKEAADHT